MTTGREPTWHTLAALALLLAVALPVLFINLGDRQLQTWDEGLYAAKARNGLHHEVYLYAVDEDGGYSEEFGKPPLGLWAIGLSFTAFGASMTALRVPFALSTLLMAFVCFFWGRRLSPRAPPDPWRGLAWGAAVVLCDGALIWGRSAMVDVLLASFSILAIFCYARAVDESTRLRSTLWATAAGCALALGFLSKQLAVATAVLPLVLFELTRLVREGPVAPFRRLFFAGLPALATTVGWFGWVYARVGDIVIEDMVDKHVSKRLEQFQGTAHYNWLNRSSDALTNMIDPWSWPLALAGLLLCALWVQRTVAQEAQDAPEPSPSLPSSLWLVPLYAGSIVLAYDLVSKSLMVWYLFPLVPALMLGVGFCALSLVRVSLCWMRGENVLERTRPELLAAALGLAQVVGGSFTVLHESLSQLGVAMLMSVAVVVVALTRPGRWSSQGRRVALVALALLIIAVFSLGIARDPRLRDGTSRMEALMNALGDEDAQRVSVDRRFRTRSGKHEKITFFGTAHKQGPAPWVAASAKRKKDARQLAREQAKKLNQQNAEKQRAAKQNADKAASAAKASAGKKAADKIIAELNASPDGGPLDGAAEVDAADVDEPAPPEPAPKKLVSEFDARVELHSAPADLDPRKGMRARRVAGATIYLGDLTVAPYEDGDLGRKLDKGPATFEAEAMASGRRVSIYYDDDASGGAGRAANPWMGERLKKGHVISMADTIEFPKGEYVAVWYLAWDCLGFDHQSLARINVRGTGGGGSHTIECDEGDGAPYQEIEVPFRLYRDASLGFRLTFSFGRVWHDRTEIWRKDTWEARKRKAAKPKKDKGTKEKGPKGKDPKASDAQDDPPPDEGSEDEGDDSDEGDADDAEAADRDDDAQADDEELEVPAASKGDTEPGVRRVAPRPQVKPRIAPPRGGLVPVIPRAGVPVPARKPDDGDDDGP